MSINNSMDSIWKMWRHHCSIVSDRSTITISFLVFTQAEKEMDLMHFKIPDLQKIRVSSVFMLVATGLLGRAHFSTIEIHYKKLILWTWWSDIHSDMI